MKNLRSIIREGFNVAVIMGLGDVIAQMGIEKKSFKEWDKGRTLRFSGIGLVVVGPILRKWYGTLETLVHKEQPAFHRAVKKVLLDQLAFAPPFTLFLSFLVPFVNGEKKDDIMERIRRSYFTILARTYMVWPPAQLINFTFVPIQYQVMFAQCVAVLWNCYLSIALND